VVLRVVALRAEAEEAVEKVAEETAVEVMAVVRVEVVVT
jgi:hypothetical protein